MHLVIHTCRTSASCAWRGGAARLPRRLDAEQLLGPKVELTIDFDFCRSEAPATSVWVVPPNNEDDGVMGVGLLLQQVRAEEVDVVAPPGLEPLPLDPTTRHESMAEDVKHLQARRHGVCMCSLSTPHEPIFLWIAYPGSSGRGAASWNTSARAPGVQRSPRAPARTQREEQLAKVTARGLLGPHCCQESSWLLARLQTCSLAKGLHLAQVL